MERSRGFLCFCPVRARRSKLQAAVFAEALEKTKALGAGIEENDKRGVKEVQVREGWML